ncbi:retrovirus-related pol polyprotein from transposon TNT 1-94 [Tanacetum coccineum]
MEVQIVFDQIDTAAQQFSVDKQYLEIAKKELFLENDRFLQQIMYQDVLLTVMNSMSLFSKFVNMDGKRKESCNLEAELLKSQNVFNDILKSYSQLEKYSQLQDKDSTIYKLKDIIKSIREKSKEENVNYDYGEIETKNVELENRLKCSTSKCGSKPTGNKRNDRISRTPSRNMKNKVEAQPRKVNKKNHVIKTIRDNNVKHLLLNVNSEPICATCSSKIAKIVESKNANHSEPNATDIPSSSFLIMTVRFRNDNTTRIMGYGDYQLGNVTILRVYYIEGLGHNLFSIGQFCDADLEVVFQKNTCFVHNLEGVDLLSGSHDTNLYTISLDDMLKTFLICFLSKASKIKSWLWRRRLSHLNFGTLNKLAKDSLTRGIPRIKFHKDHLCLACALGKSKKSSHQPKAEDTNQEKLYLLHMDLCGPMRVASINGKRYILVIVDDYSRFTWVRFLRTKDEAPEAIIKCIKNIQVRLNATVCCSNR